MSMEIGLTLIAAGIAFVLLGISGYVVASRLVKLEQRVDDLERRERVRWRVDLFKVEL